MTPNQYSHDLGEGFRVLVVATDKLFGASTGYGLVALANDGTAIT